MNEVLAGLSVVSTICAIVFGYVAFARNGKRDVADEAKSDATVLTEIGCQTYAWTAEAAYRAAHSPRRSW